ncbi:MAG: Crp/Fnr family transcriptional regulator [Saprospiraceae bacterium]|nr:Crp/Fnr family transcriptional regulator [Saprospiraceae bacterium]MDZ4706055.1 Crp/Fnr family transcriptional regulator [Saprospiraceae bacterium]
MNEVQIPQEELARLVQVNYPQLGEMNLKEEILTVGKALRFEEGEVMMDYGSYVRFVPLILEGSIKVTREGNDGTEILLYYIKAGESCTMSFTCCMLNKKSEIRTEAEEDTLVLGIPLKYIDEWMNRYPTWKNFVMLSYDNRMLELIKTIDSLVFQKMDERLLKYLQTKVETKGTDVIGVTHQEIATDLNASREAISRLLKQMEKQGLVQLGRNMIRVKKKQVSE